MKVLKFGGTSVGTVDSLRNVKAIVDSLDEPAVVIVSALGGLTDRLIATAKTASSGDEGYRSDIPEIKSRHREIIRTLVPSSKQHDVLEVVEELLGQLVMVYQGLYLIRDLPERVLDQVVSYGERMSSVIVASILNDAVHADSLEIVKTEKWYGKNIADRELTELRIKTVFPLPLAKTVVAGGFISRDKDTGEITNLGRGGSDYTAALIAAALDASVLEIWTDVDGFMTADPRITKEARVVDRMSFAESMELCSFGAKVIYPPTIYPVFNKNIPIRILNTHNPKAPGTTISDSKEGFSESIRGISALKGTRLLSVILKDKEMREEISSRIRNAMFKDGINIVLSPDTGNDWEVAVVVMEGDAKKALESIGDELAPEISSYSVEYSRETESTAVLVAVRDGIRLIEGLGKGIKNALAERGIRVSGVAEGGLETTVALTVPEEYMQDAVCIAHSFCFNRDC